MKQFRVIASVGNSTIISGWYDAYEWTVQEILDFIVTGFSCFNYQIEYR